MPKVRSGPRVMDPGSTSRYAMHPTTVLHRDNGEEVLLCGHTWCRGTCGLPQARTASGLRVAGMMTAYGPVLQEPRCSWTGPIVTLSEEEEMYLKDKWWL